MIDKSLVIIPTLKERANLEKLIPAIFDFLPGISVLVVDDNSDDGTGPYLISIKNNYPNLFFISRTEDFGYGKACIAGFLWGRLAMPSNGLGFRHIVTMDADFSHDYKAIPGMIEKLRDNDVVIGSRYVRGGKIQNWKLHRRLLSRGANLYVRTILRSSIKDFTTGFNAYRRDIFSLINFGDLKSDGYAFLVELKYRLSQSGAKIIEYPIVFSERREGESKMSPKIIWESIKLPWSLSTPKKPNRVF